MHVPTLFASFFMAGFECSTHRRRDRRRLDLLAATKHDRLAAQDYARVAGMGLRTVRDGLRWHRVETAPGHYDWSSFLPMLEAARTAGVQVIWDLCHYGWPDGLDIWRPEFVDRFAGFAAAAARVIREQTGESPLVCPVNEISFWAWAGGDQGRFNPGARRRGYELKRQLVRATIAGIEAVRGVDPKARFVQVEPLIHVVGGRYNEAQFQAWDMLSGRLEPELGGGPRYLDIVGVNYYPQNQWVLRGGMIPLGHHRYRPFRDLVAGVHARYGRPVLIAETGAEGSARAAWFHYVAAEARAAMAAGTPIEGLCLYPVVDYPGWEDGRLCATGLLGAAGADGCRPVHLPLADELGRQQALLAEAFTTTQPARRLDPAA